MPRPAPSLPPAALLPYRPRRRRRSRRLGGRLARLGLLLASGLLLVLLLAEPDRRAHRGFVPKPPPPVERTIPPPLAELPLPAQAVETVSASAALEAAAASEPAEEATTAPPEESRVRLSAPLVPPPEPTTPHAVPHAGEPAPATLEPRPAPPLAVPAPGERGPENVRPIPVAFPGPLVRPPVGRAGALAIVLDDLGPSGPATRRAIALPGPLTLAFLPYAELTGPLAREARAAGHEVFVHLPMEPVGNEDPGPMALLAGLPDEELRRRLLWAIGRVPGATGVNNHMGSRLTADVRAMALVVRELDRLGLPFVDSMTTGASVAASLALESGLPTTARDVFLDNDPAPAAIRARLEQAERLARRSGSALAIGHPYPATLQVLADWLPRARERGLRLVTATSLIELRGCRGELATRGGCLLRASGEPDAGERLPGCLGEGC
ncbi:MAG: divergent polysaccharide deacetylase family protein [Geminicoccaceae bacterium]|nr:divergent polysaccharide deacetylase family protein [Geminicoccaceae bacterium]